MRRLGICALLLSALAAMLAAQSHAPAPAAAPAPSSAHPSSAAPVQTFSTYCVECHGQDKPEAGISVERLLGQLSLPEIGEQGNVWENVAEMLESGEMPPKDAKRFPTDEEREAAASWVRSSLAEYEAKHGGEPGRVTVRRLTSAEYAYAIRDLTDVDIPVGIDSSSEAVGGEGFANFGDVQFVHDATVERYLEAARQVADHAIIGAGPLDFYTDAGKTGLELSALQRIQQLYQARGFRVVSGEGGRPYGFDRYSKAMLVAWRYKHRAALGAPQSTLRGLATDEGITGRFAEHIWDVMNRTATGYPVRLTVDSWQALDAPDADATASIQKARGECDRIVKQLVSWPSWFFARGDLAAGGAGDESPLVFDDTTLGVEPRHSYVYQLNRRLGPKAPAPPPGPWTVHVTTDALHGTPGATPVVIWRNPRIVVREARTIPADATAAQLRAMPPAPILATHALRQVVAAEDVTALAFGTSPDGTAIGPDDFAVAKAAKFAVNVPAEGKSVELQADVELAGEPNAVVRVFIGSRPDQSARDPGQRVFLGNPSSAGYRTFRAGVAEYVALLPPNSHGEANPADKDPVPAPFDNTYNSPEHDAFVTKVKYQRTDDFFTRNIVDGDERAELEAAWNDLFGSWPYHDAYLGMLWDHYSVTGASRRIVDMTPARIARLPAPVRPHVRALRAHYDQVSRAMKAGERRHVADALALAGMAWRRPLSDAERANLLAFYNRLARDREARSRRGNESARRPHPRLAGLPLPARDRAARQRAAAQLVGDRQPSQLLPLVVDSRRGAASRGGGRDAERSGGAGRPGAPHDRRPEGAAACDGVLRPVARLLSLRPASRRRYRALPRVHQRRQGGDVRRGDLELRVHDSAVASGERHPARRLHLPEHDARAVLRARRTRQGHRYTAARRQRARPGSRRRAAPRLGADGDLGAAQDQSRQAGRLGPAGASSARGRRRRRPTPATSRRTTRPLAA